MRLLLALLAFYLAAASGQALAQDPGVVTSLTLEEMEAILKAEGYRYERVKEGEAFYLLRMAGLRAGLFLSDCEEGRCSTLILYAHFTMEKPPTLERINTWNRERRFSRAYLDEDGYPALEADLDLEGGVTRRAIALFLDLFEENLSQFAAWIGFR